ncbi:MAG TPA: 1,4-dihydroxy-2-naphthoate polyprenyltransferase [Actinomycetales bacterium]|nr:1,4-dihydroxy-2-naphthoate polyprenyltransferase [Actinomycetales bacterium]
MATVTDWLEGARLRTLPAALAPVILGTFSAYALGSGSIPRALLAGGLALALQVGVNFANDYSDGVRGTDDVRTGPPRLTGGGKVSPQTVKYAAFASFGIGALLGLVLVALAGQWWLLAVGAAAVVAAWYYTGGSRPYGYMGLGEVFVFVFFGLVATLGTTYTQALRVDAATWLGAAGVGLIACAILMANNIRDIPTDRQVGKKTLAVRLGQRGARVAYVAMIGVPVLLGVVAALWYPWALLTLLLAPAVWWLSRPVLAGSSGTDLIPVLRDTGFFEIAYGLLFGLGLVLG